MKYDSCSVATRHVIWSEHLPSLQSLMVRHRLDAPFQNYREHSSPWFNGQGKSKMILKNPRFKIPLDYSHSRWEHSLNFPWSSICWLLVFSFLWLLFECLAISLRMSSTVVHPTRLTLSFGVRSSIIYWLLRCRPASVLSVQRCQAQFPPKNFFSQNLISHYWA